MPDAQNQNSLILSCFSPGSVEISGFVLGFQPFPWDLANVNEWKVMLDPTFI